MKASTSRNVSDLVRSPRTPSWEKTLETSTNREVDDLLGKHGKSQNGRHFHQLFRQLRNARITVHKLLLDTVFWDVGHVDNLLDGGLHVQEPENIDQLFSHLRQRHIENRNVRIDLIDVLAGVPLHPIIPANNLRQRWWPDPAGLFIKDIEELRLGEKFVRTMAVTCNSYLSPAPGLVLSPWGGVVRPGAWRRLAVRAERTGVTVALAASWRSLRLQHNVPTTSIQQKGHS